MSSNSTPQKTCDHFVGNIANSEVDARCWNKDLMSFVAKVDDFNSRGQRDQINHPGFITEYKFCPRCAQPINRAALNLMTYGDAFERFTSKQTMKKDNSRSS